MKTTSSSGISKALYHNGVIYCYLERENYKTLKFHGNNLSYFKISASLFLKTTFKKATHAKVLKLKKCWGPLSEEILFKFF